MERQPRLWTGSFLNVCASNFLVFLVFYLLFVTMPIYTMESIGVAEGEAGLIITVFLLAAILIRPLSGQWVESFGRKPVVVIALSIFLGSSFLYLWFDSFSTLLIIRFIQGIGFGMGTTALGAIAADVIPDQRKGEGLGYFAMSMNFAMVIGPFLGLTLIQNAGFTVMFYVCVALAVLALLTGLVIRVDALAAPAKKSLVPSMHNLLEKPVIPIALTGAVMALAYAGGFIFCFRLCKPARPCPGG
ncbi:MFS transporter [Halobacillus litoralis]|uniref:MFS transporter n=1 Tax=Halobacillus litoralis TaxID=45668 RepID=UPI0027402432|nr:MFS transporter [Halobacillus litoralis]WLR48815.1 MFS transporter [Halobacillus litoralis]